MAFPKTQLNDALFNQLGVSATLNDTTLTVLDDTKGTSLPGSAIIESIGPSARVRMAELTANSIDTTSLKDATITFNGNAWRIKTHKMLPSRNGESDGLVRLMLLSEG